jgi:hypothetical protein
LVPAGDENNNIQLNIKIYRNADIIEPRAEKFRQVLLHSNLPQADLS